jgi:hypothetical protein
VREPSGAGIAGRAAGGGSLNSLQADLGNCMGIGCVVGAPASTCSDSWASSGTSRLSTRERGDSAVGPPQSDAYDAALHRHLIDWRQVCPHRA